jgi:transcriptional regulator with XRE-family HTH domain
VPARIRTPQYTLCALLVTVRREAGLSQRQLGARLGKPNSFVCKIESGYRHIDIAEFVAIAKALKLDPRKLFDRWLALEESECLR